ncbi:MAG TPA: MBL fold metallo-hydrolase [Acidobacteriaceae bacterium]|nr:MBL fold metallo-hydrolase [Acidobacteriaceae bacterium]
MKTKLKRQSAVLSKVQSLSTLVGESAFCSMAGESKLPVLVGPEELGITFIGHSSFLLQIAGRNVLIDPVFATRLIALRRMRRVGVKVKDLPPVDTVLLSHAHMDHLNRPSLRRIVRHTRRLTGRSPSVVVPWGVEDLVSDIGFSRVTTLEWWQSKHVGGLEITMTPSKHWGARFFKDTHRGFGGYVIRGGGRTVYHSGDTAYFDGFAKIGKRLKPEVALLPIGAYQPDSYRNVHTSPEDALQAFLDLGAQQMIPMHYGTFRLSQEPVGEPVQRLMAAADAAGVAEKICVLEEGDTEVASPSQEPSVSEAAACR